MPVTITTATVTRVAINISEGKAVSAAADYTVTDGTTTWANTFTWQIDPNDQANIDQLLPALTNEMAFALGLTIELA